LQPERRQQKVGEFMDNLLNKSRDNKSQQQCAIYTDGHDDENSYATPPMYVGIGYILVYILVTIFWDDIGNTSKYFTCLFLSFAFITKIIPTIWIGYVGAKSKNRNSNFWGIFTFLFPSISLIIFSILRNNNPQNPKLDLQHKRIWNTVTEIVAVLIGLSFLTFVTCVLVFFLKRGVDDSYIDVLQVLGFLLPIKIGIIFWVCKMAETQNRDTTGWGYFALFCSSLPLIILALSSKIRDNETCRKSSPYLQIPFWTVMVVLGMALSFSNYMIIRIMQYDEYYDDYDNYDNYNVGYENGLLLVRKNYKYGFIDKFGRKAIPLVYDYATSFEQGIARVSIGEHKYKNYKYQGGKWSFIDRKGNVIIPFQYYQYVHNFSEGLAAVKKEDRWGYIDKDGKVIIDLLYYEAYRFKNGIAEVMIEPAHYNWGEKTRSAKYALIDKTGKIVKEE
ncbi:MAG: WG repeat-containing protein, partial [Dysgonamonadaceae bacterium]|jgi:hypothetical protein|nr:WG repeat-containing protein [Dysgonamonadaceae bacterium]